MNSYSCEVQCDCDDVHGPTKLVVLTGGPGAGKTAILEYVRKIFCRHVVILPEAASILFGGGFWRLDSISARKAEQRAIYKVQSESENLVLDENKWLLGLCDRGCLDSLAYWPGSQQEFFDSLGTTLEKEYAKYMAVIHLESPDDKDGYNHQNPVRVESAIEAAKIGRRIHEIWKNHPNFHSIKSTHNFIEKVNRAEELIRRVTKDCCKNHCGGLPL